MQQNDHINKLLNAEKRTKQVTPELINTKSLGEEDALQQRVTQQTNKRDSEGNKEQNAVRSCQRQSLQARSSNRKYSPVAGLDFTPSTSFSLDEIANQVHSALVLVQHT